MYFSKISGIGAYLPEKIITNYDLEKIMDTSHDWIVQRTGITQRHVAADNEFTSHMAIQSSLKAMENRGFSASDIDFIICATTTPDQTFPATAVKVQHALGIQNAFSFDVQAACSGFVYALSVGDNFIKTGQGKRGLIIGAEKMTSLLDWNDRTTSILFGDGAGTFVIERTESTLPFSGIPYDKTTSTYNAQQGILGTYLHSDGQFADILYTNGGASSSEKVGKIVMNGGAVYKQAIIKLAESLEEILIKHHLSADQIDWFVPHQANERIIDAVARKLDFPQEKVIKTVALHANTSAASIPLALDSGVKNGQIKPGQLVLIDALGAGLTWGSAIIRW